MQVLMTDHPSGGIVAEFAVQNKVFHFERLDLEFNPP
jgi:hypothetical protein